MERILTLSLKRKWFDLIKSGVKTEEYRELKHYWSKRLNLGYGKFKEFDKVAFTMGYPKADDESRRIEFKNPKIRIDTGRKEWGAKPHKMYFVITWEGK